MKFKKAVKELGRDNFVVVTESPDHLIDGFTLHRNKVAGEQSFSIIMYNPVGETFDISYDLTLLLNCKYRVGDISELSQYMKKKVVDIHNSRLPASRQEVKDTMNFIEAVKKLKEGHVVRRRSKTFPLVLSKYNNNTIMEIRGEGTTARCMKYPITIEDILSTDYIVERRAAQVAQLSKISKTQIAQPDSKLRPDYEMLQLVYRNHFICNKDHSKYYFIYRNEDEAWSADGMECSIMEYDKYSRMFRKIATDNFYMEEGYSVLGPTYEFIIATRISKEIVRFSLKLSKYALSKCEYKYTFEELKYQAERYPVDHSKLVVKRRDMDLVIRYLDFFNGSTRLCTLAGKYLSDEEEPFGYLGYGSGTKADWGFGILDCEL